MTQTEDTTSIDNIPIDILLVEDNEADIKIALRAFQKAKIKNNIFVVRDGQEALDYMYHQNQYASQPKFSYPDMILLDIQLPKLTGFDVLQVLKKDDKLKAIPVVALTSSKNDKDVIKSYSYGAVSYIQKPVDYQEFEKTVEAFNYYWCIINKLPNLK
jgi:two-component system response regulator